MQTSCCLVVLLLALVQGSNVPSFIKPCARSDPNFNECAVQSAKEGIPIIAKGDRKLGLPSLTPLKIQEVKIVDGGGLSLVLHDLIIQGLEDAVPEKMNFDFDKGIHNQYFIFPRLMILSNYVIAGRLLLLPITGNGVLNATFINSKFSFSHGTKFKKINGEDHMEILDLKSKLTPQRLHLSLTNLFNGDKLLGNEMNKFLDENWKEVYRELAPSIESTFANIISSLLTSVNNAVPYNKIFPASL